MNDVEIWLAQKAEPYWFLRSNAEIEQFLSCRKTIFSETDFFIRIGHKETFICGGMPPLAEAISCLIYLSCHPTAP